MAGKYERYPFAANMRLRLRKPHPCGGNTWFLIRVGADARLECETCKHQLTMSRRVLEKSTLEVIEENSERK